MLTDVKCQKCGKIYTDKILFNNETVTCECGNECEKIPALSASFRLKYDNKKDKVSWGAEGFSESQYYREQKKLCKGNIFVQSGGKKKSEKQ